jgi:hypothetical protein
VVGQVVSKGVLVVAGTASLWKTKNKMSISQRNNNDPWRKYGTCRFQVNMDNAVLDTL